MTPTPESPMHREARHAMGCVKVIVVLAAVAGFALAWPWLTAPPSAY